MKTWTKIICLSVCVFGSSCKENFLELAPVSQTNVNGFFRNAADIETAVNAAYGSLKTQGQYNFAMYAIGEVRSDNTEILDVQSGIDLVQIDAFTTISNNGLLNTMWSNTYNGIQQCNIVINRTAGVSMDQALKDRYVGEVKFLRALMYFNLVRTFGEIPLVITEVENVKEGYMHRRESIDAVYSQIIDDLTDAEQSLPSQYSGNNIGRATSGAAKTLLGKVYLTLKQFDLAAAKLKEVIDSGEYDLLPDYADIFKTTNKNHRESIFEIQYLKGGISQGSPFNNRFAPRQSGTIVSTVGAGAGHNTPTQDMADAYEPMDLRKDISMAEGYINQGQFVPVKYVKKYLDTPFQPEDADNNWPVLRYADVLLMYAEAQNELGFVPDGEAFQLLNHIRERAGLAAKTATNPDVSLRIPDQAAFRLAIEQERRVELAFENHRWFDLVRTGRAIDVMQAHGIAIQEHQLVLPIPQSQIDINPGVIKQNPGY